jgi:ketosteroid isomerase-like protein
MLCARPAWLETVMIEHPNSLLVHHCLQAAGEGDRHTLRALWAPDIVWHIKGRSPWRGDVKGADRILEHLAEIGNLGVAGLQTDIEDVMVSNDRAALICHAHAKIGNRVLDADYLIIAKIIGRRIQEITSIPVDPDCATEFWIDAASARTSASTSSPFASA